MPPKCKSCSSRDGGKLRKRFFSTFLKFVLCVTLLVLAFTSPSQGGGDDVSAEDDEESAGELRRTTNEVEPEFAEPIPNITIPVGRDIQLPCIVDNLGSYRAAWIKVETKAILTIHHHIITRNYRISLSHSDNRNFVLHIRNVQKSDRGGYMCQINTAPMKSQIGYVDVLVPPDIIMNESSTDITAREGTNVSLVCKAKGYPSPNISWRREDNQPIPLGTWHGKKVLATSFDGAQLNISRVSRLHMGAYLCIASNGVPPSVSRRILLHVNFPPVMWIPNQLVGAPLDKDVTLDCHTEAYPASINYWAKDGGDMIINDAKYETSIKEKNYKVHMRLAIKNLEPQDFGTYKCFAENSLGSTEGSIRLYEIPPPTSEPTKDTAAIRRQSVEEVEVFPRHQSLGSAKNSGKETEDTEGDQSKNPVTDGKYRASEEAAAAHEDHSQTSNRKRNRSGSEKVSEKSASGGFKTKDIFQVLILVLAVLLTIST
ncbi:lachesin-like isoform X2 [Argiope bruennichi]|uniref:lachesin-like isoform X2 n=1 Tax=Argiope bruennichi TaxID=94029 RepID=UPI0024941435|nr:lachesin-like isoform X2 [Argiope bruennichi]